MSEMLKSGSHTYTQDKKQIKAHKHDAAGFSSGNPDKRKLHVCTHTHLINSDTDTICACKL